MLRNAIVAKERTVISKFFAFGLAVIFGQRITTYD